MCIRDSGHPVLLRRDHEDDARRLPYLEWAMRHRHRPTSERREREQSKEEAAAKVVGEGAKRRARARAQVRIDRRIVPYRVRQLGDEHAVRLLDGRLCVAA
eukprot:1302487-Prymnesium_polylepis.1